MDVSVARDYRKLPPNGHSKLAHIAQLMAKLLQCQVKFSEQLDGCIVWNAHNTVLGEEALLIYIVPVCYVKRVGMERPSNIIISLHWKKISIITNIPLIIN